MMSVRILIFAALLVLAACAGSAWRSPDRFDLFDAERQRRIPIVIYGADDAPRPLAILSPGYGAPPDAYNFLASHLTARGYVVAAIQHDLEGDEAPANSGNIATLRRPIWERGAANIAFAIGELRERRLANDDRVLLVGHSQGGDISMLYAESRAADLDAVFSLDNRRMRIPRTNAVTLCTIRSSDFPADRGVLPTAEEQAQHQITIVASDIPHDAMSDAANNEQRAQMLSALDNCLSARALGR